MLIKEKFFIFTLISVHVFVGIAQEALGQEMQVIAPVGAGTGTVVGAVNSAFMPSQTNVAQANATAGSNTVGTQAKQNTAIATEAFETKKKAQDHLQRLNKYNEQLTQRIAGASAQSRATPNQPNQPNLVQAILKEPEMEFTKQKEWGNKAFVENYEKLRDHTVKEIKKLQQIEQYHTYQAQGNYLTSMELGKHAAQLFQQSRDLGSDLDSNGDPKTSLNRDLKASQQTKSQALRAETGSGDLEASLSKGGNSDKFSAELTGPRKNLDEKPAIVPDSFVKELETKLSKIREEKEALDVIREMGRSAGIDALANIKSLDELNTLEQKAAGEPNGAGTINNAGGGVEFAEGEGTATQGGVDEETGEFVKTVQGALANVMANMRSGEAGDDLGGDLGRGLASGGGGGGGGAVVSERQAEELPSLSNPGPNAELFSRVKKLHERYVNLKLL